MFRPALVFCLICTLFTAGPVAAADGLALLEAASATQAHQQAGLERYQVTVETNKIAEMIQRMTASMPPDLPRPEVPVLTKYWQREPAVNLLLAEGANVSPYVQQMIDRFSANLAVDLDGILLPAGQTAARAAIAARASLKTAETSLAEQLLHRIELNFSEPTDLGGAFYAADLRLPQKGVTALTFDIDATTKTLREMTVMTAAGLKLSVEIRYHRTATGYLPERISVTSPDGRIDDSIEVVFGPVGAYVLPQKMLRKLHRPDLQEELAVTFRDYIVNAAFPAGVRELLHATP